eukprot:2590433-Prymnesium_polylepis.1
MLQRARALRSADCSAALLPAAPPRHRRCTAAAPPVSPSVSARCRPLHRRFRRLAILTSVSAPPAAILSAPSAACRLPPLTRVSAPPTAPLQMATPNLVDAPP